LQKSTNSRNNSPESERISLAVGSDHRGFELKSYIVRYFQDLGYNVIDIGTDSTESADYTDYAIKVGEMVSSGRCKYGILICNTGIGMSIAANKVKGVRAALCCDTEMARIARLHNDANIICLAGGYIKKDEAIKMVEAFLRTEFEGTSCTGERHYRRVRKIIDYEGRGKYEQA